MTPHPEKRLIAIDAETVEEVRLLELDIRTYANYLERHQQPGPAASARRKATALRNILAAWEEGERTTGLRRGHLADLEVIEAILRSDPREEASEYAANPRAMADAVRNMIEDPDLHNPESPGPIVFETDPAPQEAE